MPKVTVRETSAELPDIPDEAELAQVESLDAKGGLIWRFELIGTSYRALDLSGMRLLDGRVRSAHAEKARVNGLDARSVEFANCELGGLQWTGGKLSRTRFDGCKLLGARFENVTLDHVVFSDCILDYAMVNRIRATGPVLFVRCSLREAEFRGCNLAHSLFDDCNLGLTDFGPGHYRGSTCAATTCPAYAELITSVASSSTAPNCFSWPRHLLRTLRSASAMTSERADRAPRTAARFSSAPTPAAAPTAS